MILGNGTHSGMRSQSVILKLAKCSECPMRPSIPNPDAPSPATLGERILAIRKAWGWPQEKMSETMHVDQASISFWERDVIIPSGSSMIALSALFRLSVEALETGVGFMIPDPPSYPPRANRGVIRSVSLPVDISDPVAVIDLGNGASSGKQISDTMVDLVEAMKSGRRIWIVVD